MGDANLDGAVNAADLNVVGLNWLKTGCVSWSDGDFNGDNQVNPADLNIIGLNWATAAAAPAAAFAAYDVNADVAPVRGVDAGEDLVLVDLAETNEADRPSRQQNRQIARRSRASANEIAENSEHEYVSLADEVFAGL